MLNRLRLEGLKSIQKMDLELNSLNVLIGANGAGKSNFISFFELLHFMMTDSLQTYIAKSGYAHSILYYGPKTTPQISADLYFSTPRGQNHYHFRLVYAANDTLIFADETVAFSSGTLPRPYSLGAGHKEAQLTSIEDLNNIPESRMKTAKAIKKVMEQWKVYHFHDTSSVAKIRNQGYVHDNKYLRDDAGNLAAFLYMLQKTKPEYYGRITRVINQIAPFFSDFVLEPDSANPQYSILNWREKGSQDIMGPHQLSDGTLRMMALTTLLLQPHLPDLIIIDEPELGLHPFAITVLAGLIKQASASTQVIVSTQSVTLLDQFESKDIVVVDRIDSQSFFHRLSDELLDEWLEEYSLGTLWEKNVLGGRPTYETTKYNSGGTY